MTHTPDQLRQVAELHASRINQGFLATLGPRFLSLMYEAIDSGTGSVLITETKGDRVLGFVAGGTGMGPIYRQLLRRPIRLALALSPSIFRPSVLAKLWDIFRYGAKTSSATLPSAELLSIAVHSDTTGSGVGERLYRELIGHFRSQSVSAFKITVGQTLEPAHRFYRRLGATPVAMVEVHPGAQSTVYVQHIEPRANSPR